MNFGQIVIVATAVDYQRPSTGYLRDTFVRNEWQADHGALSDTITEVWYLVLYRTVRSKYTVFSRWSFVLRCAAIQDASARKLATVTARMPD